MEWIFDGIGTEVIGIGISLIIGAVGGGFAGYKIGTKHITKQNQRAGNNSEQRQELKIRKNGVGTTVSKNKTSIKQAQKAGDTAVQTQIGGINDEWR